MPYTGVRPDIAAAIQYAVAVVTSAGYSATPTSGLRTQAEQSRLYRRAKLGMTGFPAAPPGQSYHQVGRAVDVVFDPRIAAQVGAWWNAIGGRWHESDPIHFEA